MRLSFCGIALMLGVAALAPAVAGATTDKPFQLKRMARAAKPGLHIKLIDPAGTLAYPVPISVEYDRGNPVRAEATAEGVTVPAEEGRTVRAVTVGGASPQRFDVDGSSANFLLFSR